MAISLHSLIETRTRRVLLCVGFWSLMVALSTVETFVWQQVYGKGIEWSLAVRRAAEEWYLWCLLSFPILWFAGKVVIGSGKARLAVLAHLLASMVASLLVITGHSWLLHGQYSLDGSVFQFGRVFQKLVLQYFEINMIFYWMIVMSRHGWIYYQRFRERERAAAALQTELVEARLETLRMQLNPHFLFNTLHTISALIHEHPEMADRMVARLSELLRTALARGEDLETPLREEAAFLKKYLEIEQTRFADRLTVRLSIEPETEDYLVPSLILQPLVENAIRHGVEQREEHGTIEVGARRVADRIELRIADDGPGLSPNARPTGRRGIGVANTRSRLDHMYGSHHDFELRPRLGGGIEAIISIPARKATPQQAPSAQPRESVVAA